ncbi:hypothetical protein [Priestia megaterium]|uniref:hypothetical protein n=1 Tax=Priestia megaterium TaxID=1404 RepID=UPI00186946C9|nr:hypothetical protein [Priestia megaterium]MBE2977813.1 hypothetical protein [Priestia megaterium]
MFFLLKKQILDIRKFLFEEVRSEVKSEFIKSEFKIKDELMNFKNEMKREISEEIEYKLSQIKEREKLSNEVESLFKFDAPDKNYLSDDVEKIFEEYSSDEKTDNSVSQSVNLLFEGVDRENKLERILAEEWFKFKRIFPSMYDSKNRLDSTLDIEYTRKLLNLYRWFYDRVNNENHYKNTITRRDELKEDVELLLELFMSLLVFEKTVFDLGFSDFKLNLEFKEQYEKIRKEYYECYTWENELISN